MAKGNIVQAWLDHVHEDISAAEDLHKTGHQLYVAFLCHQAIEKALKAYYIATHDEQKVAAARSLTKDICEHIITTTKQLTQWIEERLPEKKPSMPSGSTSE